MGERVARGVCTGCEQGEASTNGYKGVFSIAHKVVGRFSVALGKQNVFEAKMETVIAIRIRIGIRINREQTNIYSSSRGEL